MNVLITNSRLDGKGGSQSFVRDLGAALKRLGHAVVCYSSDPGVTQRLTAKELVPIFDKLEDLPFRPDIIHGQHHLDAMAAIIGLQGVPAIYHCHGAVWRESAPRHPRIYHYVAMSRTLGERIMVEASVSASHVTAWLNTVDLRRFCHVRAPSERPTRALFYNKIHHAESPTVGAILAAARQLGIELDFVGHKFGREISRPEAVLPEYDIVFASGKSAIDALASGCAVIVLGRTSCGEMVTSQNYERLRAVNFSIAVNSPPPDGERIEQELRRYRSEDCAAVAERLRRDADIDACVPRLVEIYEQAICRHRETVPDLRAELLAAHRYLRRIVPLVRGADLAPAPEAVPILD